MSKEQKVRDAISPLLKQGEVLARCMWGVQRPGSLALIGVVVLAALLTWLLFGAGASSQRPGVSPFAIVRFLFFLALIGGPIAHLARGHILALTDRRLLLVTLKPQYFGFNPRPSRKIREYVPGSWPTVTLSRFGAKRTLVITSSDLKLKLDFGTWPENVAAAEAIANRMQEEMGGQRSLT